MAQQKEYIAKVYDQDGTSFLKSFIFSPNGTTTLKSLPTFRSVINGGLGECVLDLDLPFDDFDFGVSVNIMNIVDIWVTDSDNPRGRRVYRGYMSQIAPYFDSTQNEGVRVTLLGLVSLLSYSHYKNGSSFTVAHTSQDPETIARAIIDHFNTIYSGSLLSYTGASTDPVGTTVSVTFTDQKWSEAIQKTVELAGTDWWWKVDADGLFSLLAKPGTATHTFTIGKDIERIEAPLDSEKVVNDVQVRRNGGTTSDYSDATSQATYGTGSSPSGKRTAIISDTSLTDATAADQRGNKEINDHKDAKVKSPFVVNTKYDIESVKVGQTCRIANFKYGSSFFGTNMLIVAVQYNGDTVEIELEEEGSNFGSELSGFISSQSSSSSSSSGSSSSAGFVDRETPSGTINSSNTAFTLSQTPVSGSEHVYLNGVLQNAAGADYSIAGTAITFVTAPPTGSTLLVSYRTSSGSTNFVDREVPTPATDGSTTAFTLAHTPTTGADHVYLNGILQNAGAVDYSISGTTITFATAPPSGSTLLTSYRY